MKRGVNGPTIFHLYVGLIVLAVACAVICILLFKNYYPGDSEVEIWIPVYSEGPIFRTKAPNYSSK